MATTYTRARPRTEAAQRVEALLQRYPNLREQELAELINLFPTLSILDQALMTGESALAGKFTAFNREHGKKLKGSLPSMIVFLSVPAAIMAVTVWFLLAS